MENNAPITDAELAELKRLRRRSFTGQWRHQDYESEFHASILCAFDGLVARLEAAEAALRWRPIEEAPKDGTKVDLWTGNGRIADCWWKDGHWKHWWIGGFDNMGPCRIGEIPTHYLPLPAPPEATR